MNLRQLKHFLATVEHGSLGRASQALHISLPALSKSIQNLEDSLGVGLLDRGPRGMKPTVFGEALIAHAKLIEAQLDRARGEIAELKGLARGRLAIGTGPSMVQSVLPVALARLSTKHPGLCVSVIEGYGATLAKALVDGTVEFVLAPGLPGLPRGETEQEHVYTDRVVVVCRAGHPLTRLRKVGLRDLAAVPWVQVHHPDSYRQRVEIAFQAEGLSPPAPVLEANSLALIKAALAGSDAVTLLPLPAVRDDPRLVGLAHGPFDAQRKIFAIRRALGTPSPMATALIAEIREAAQYLETPSPKPRGTR